MLNKHALRNNKTGFGARIRASNPRFRALSIAGLLLISVLVLTFVETEKKVSDGTVFPRFIEPNASTTWLAGSVAKTQWTPIAVTGGSVYLELISEDLSRPGATESHLQVPVDPSFKFSELLLPPVLPARTSYQLCFFSNGLSPYAGGVGVRAFCSDQFSIFPGAVAGTPNESHVLQFSLPQRGQRSKVGSVITLAWPSFENQNDRNYYIKFLLPNRGSLVEVQREIVDVSDGRWAVALRPDAKESSNYLVCMFAAPPASADKEERLFCSDPFTLY